MLQFQYIHKVPLQNTKHLQKCWTSNVIFLTLDFNDFLPFCHHVGNILITARYSNSYLNPCLCEPEERNNIFKYFSRGNDHTLKCKCDR